MEGKKAESKLSLKLFFHFLLTNNILYDFKELIEVFQIEKCLIKDLKEPKK